jgi:drug/metabolite transporter (DMT)-like permease
MTAWKRWQDYATMVFGVLLFASPFVFGERWLHETPTLVAALGLLLVVAGIVAASTRDPRRSLIANAPGLMAVITFIGALAIGFLSRSVGHIGVALTTAVIAIATLLVGATLRLSTRK